MFHFMANHFSKVLGGPTFSRGWDPIGISNGTYRTYDFLGRSQDHLPHPLDSHMALLRLLFFNLCMSFLYQKGPKFFQDYLVCIHL